MITRGGITIRLATSADATAFDEVSETAEAQDWGTLSAPTSRSLVAEDSDGRPVGFVEAWQAGDDIEIIMIATHPSVRRNGVATALLERLIADAGSENADRVILDVSDANAPARRLYDRCGFTQIGRRHRYYRSTSSWDDGNTAHDALLLAYHFASGTA